MTDVQSDFHLLTKNIKNLAHKPLLRGTLEAELLKLGHDEKAVTQLLDDTFNVVTH